MNSKGYILCFYLIFPQLRVEVYKNPNLGFSIAGGIDSTANPFHPNDTKVCSTELHHPSLRERMHEKNPYFNSLYQCTLSFVVVSLEKLANINVIYLTTKVESNYF